MVCVIVFSAAALLCALLICLWLFVFASPSLSRRKEVLSFTSAKYAHRGLHGAGAPENSLEAFRRAVQAGYAVELDVQISKDGIPVVFHDFTLSRVCGAEGSVSDYTAEELSGMSLLGAEGTGIPRFSDVLSVIDGRVPLLVEIKERAGERAVTYAALAALDGYQGNFMIESFNPFTLGRIRKARPDILRGQLSDNFMAEKSSRSAVNFFLSLFCFNFISRPDFISYGIESRGSFIYRALKKIYRVPSFAWTVRSREEQKMASESGFETVIFENYIPGANEKDSSDKAL